MFFRRVLLLSLGLSAIGLALVLTMLPGPAHAAPGSASAATAVRALTERPAAQALTQVPDDFEAVMGYRPVIEDGHLVRGDGSCSSPMALPAAFEPACRQHDLGYDLLRYAEQTGRPLGSWARASVDGLLSRRLHQVCAAEPVPAAASCAVNARITTAAVELNSVRQRDGVPAETPASRAAAAASLAGVVGVAAAVRTGRGPRRSGPARSDRTDPRGPLARAGGALAGMRSRFWGALAPRVPSTVLVTVAVVLSLTPSLLPRPAVVQGPATGVLVAAALGMSALLRRTRPAGAPEAAVRQRQVALVIGIAVMVAALVGADLLQGDLASGTVLPPPGQAYWPTVAALAGGTAYLLVLAGRGVRAVLRTLAGMRFKRRVAVLLTGGLLSAAAAPAGGGVLDLLDKELEPGHVMLQDSPVGASRTYVSLEEGDDPDAAAELAARRLAADGGLDREAVVVLLPTGSGWVNRNAVTAFEDQFGSEVATVAVQYDRSPSWLSLMTSRETSERSAHAVVAAVVEALDTVPGADRPDLFVHGESLGALSGQSALADPVLAGEVCGALWSGIPGGRLAGVPGERALANPDDPVVHLTSSTATARPESWGAPVWLPVVSYGTTTLDLVTSLGAGDGHGHRYGPEQDWTLQPC